MRFSTGGAYERLDLDAVLGLVPSLLVQWADLRFAPDGRVINPETGERQRSLALTDGQHRKRGARYVATVRVPKMGLPEDLVDGFEAERASLRARNATPGEWQAAAERRRLAQVQVGVDHEDMHLELTRDDRKQLAATVTDASKEWRLQATLHRRVPYRLEIEVQAELDGFFGDERGTGCLSWTLTPADGSLVMDLGALERDGRLLKARGRAGRFGGTAIVDIEVTPAGWDVTARVRVRGRGWTRPLSAPILWFGRKPFSEAIDDAWQDLIDHHVQIARQLAELRDLSHESGGADRFVHRALWDSAFRTELDQLAE